MIFDMNMNRDNIQAIADYILEYMFCKPMKDKIAYTKDLNVSAPVVIYPSRFFDKDVYMTSESVPVFPLKQWDNVPLLFGENRIEKFGKKIVIYADVIASSFFVMSRYEEIIVDDNRDQHGRYIGRTSVLGKAGVLHQPLVDMYGEKLKNVCLQYSIENVSSSKGFRKVYLTHDVDVLWENFTLFQAFRRVGAELIRNRRLRLFPLFNCLGCYYLNPYDTFSKIIKWDRGVKDIYKDKCEEIYFIISNKEESRFTKAYLDDKKADRLIRRINRAGCSIGLHISYEGGDSGLLISEEKKMLESYLERPVSQSRYHYLHTKTPEDFNIILEDGFTDDYTMGYADVPGFRLGVARAINWIDPWTLEISNLRLHPLNIMDCTLYEERYCDYDCEEALSESKKIINAVYRYQGDLAILFHNTEFKVTSRKWVKKLYLDLLDYVKEKAENISVL